MDRSDPDLMGDYGQGQTEGYDLSYAVAYHKGKAGARKKDKVAPYNQNPVSTYYRNPTDASDLGLMGDYGQGQTGGCDLSYADAWNQHQAAAWNQHQAVAWNQHQAVAWNQHQAAAWNQNEMGTLNLNPVGTHHRGQTGAHNTSPQHTSGLDDITKLFQFSNPIRTRVNQSPPRDQVHDGSQSAMPYHRAFPNTNLRDPSVLYTFRLSDINFPKNPRSRSKRKEK